MFITFIVTCLIHCPAESNSRAIQPVEMLLQQFSKVYFGGLISPNLE